MADCRTEGDVANDAVPAISDPVEMTPLGKALKCVADLYHLRDHYYEEFGGEGPVDKVTMIKEKLASTIDTLDELSGQISDKCKISFLRGKALNVTQNYDERAVEHLSKVVKLDPKMAEAWNQLGECYWKKGDMVNAKNCFSGALSHLKNKESLRSLSMVMRQLAVDQSEHAKVVRESLQKAKEAVEMDIADGTSWLILGNAYMALFFAEKQNTTDIDRCFQAYSRAEKDPVTRGNPDLHHNQAVAHQYSENYQKALDGYSQAQSLDPGWKDPVNKETQIMDYLQQVVDLIKNKGKIKHKKLQSLSQSISDADLGRYGGGSYTSNSGQTIKLTKSYFSRLKEGVNVETVIVGKVISVLSTPTPVCETFLVIDEMESCYPVTLYNVGQGLKLWDTVAIPEPYLQVVSVHHNDKEFSFSSIRIHSPRVLIVNKRKLGAEHERINVLSAETKCE